MACAHQPVSASPVFPFPERTIMGWHGRWELESAKVATYILTTIGTSRRSTARHLSDYCLSVAQL